MKRSETDSKISLECICRSASPMLLIPLVLMGFSSYADAKFVRVSQGPTIQALYSCTVSQAELDSGSIQVQEKSATRTINGRRENPEANCHKLTNQLALTALLVISISRLHHRSSIHPFYLYCGPNVLLILVASHPRQ